jgi:hypothetical protein
VLALKKWEIKNPAETSLDYYSKKCSSLEEMETLIDSEMDGIIQLLKTINQKL